MNGILIYDRVDAKKSEWFIGKLICEAEKAGILLKLFYSDEIYKKTGRLKKNDGEASYHNPSLKGNEINTDFAIPECDFAIMRNRDYKMSACFESCGVRTFNSSYVCKLGNDKWEMYKELSSIPMMYTQETRLPYPFVMKPRDGHGGESVFLINNEEEYKEALLKSSERQENDKFIYQIPATERGRDVRVYAVGDVVLTAMERTAKEGMFAANYSLGGDAKEYALSDDELLLVKKVYEKIKPDFVGIDIIYNNGKPVLNEIEDAVGSRMLYAHTDIDPAKEYITWIKKSIC